MTRPTYTLLDDPPDHTREPWEVWAEQQERNLRKGVGEKLFEALGRRTMGTTAKNDRDFAEALGAGDFLDMAIRWIATNLEPEDVFGNDTMRAWGREWAEEEGYIKE
jgi:hypothetical protein